MRNLLALIVALWAVQVIAASAKPTEIAGVIKASTPYGGGEYHALWVHAYDAALWTDAKPWSFNAPFALSLTYHHAFSSSAIVDRTLSEMRRDPHVTGDMVERYREPLARVFPAVRPDDRITAVFQPPATVTFYHNGALTGTMAQPGFARPFFGIWLSEHTSAPDLRDQLLGR